MLGVWVRHTNEQGRLSGSPFSATNDGNGRIADEGRAIREANAVVAQRADADDQQPCSADSLLPQLAGTDRALFMSFRGDGGVVGFWPSLGPGVP